MSIEHNSKIYYYYTYAIDLFIAIKITDMLVKQYNSDHKTLFFRSVISSHFSFHYYKKVFFLFGFVCFFLNTFAEHIDSNDAAFIAKNIYWESAYPKEWIDYDNLLPELVYVRSVHDTVLYYIFNVPGKKGYVIVTADDRLLPVIGYAKKGAYGIGEPPPAFIAWMDAREKEILYAVRNKIQANDFIDNQWNYYRSLDPQLNYNNRGAVAPLLDPIAWGQGCYYNDSCPPGTGGIHAKTGCVATATAMVMKYHDHPEHGSGDHSYYHSTYGLLSADFGSTTYDWAGMPEPDLTTYDPDVAQLMYHVGVSVEMNYGLTGSGAYTGDAAQALIDYFNYASSVSYIAKTSYSPSEWEDTLKYELNNARPMIYRGTGPDGGHAFVCDGYDDNYTPKGSLYFHFNWGWGGLWNNYFQLTLLNPGGYNFTSDQKAVIGITPAAVSNPCNFNANTVSTTQIDLSFTCNGNGNNVVIVYNNTGSFTVPSDGSPPPAVGNPFAGGTVFYKGTSSPQSHTGLTPNNNYYYKAWSYDGSDIYSTGIEDDANTSPGNWKGTVSSDWNTNGNWLGNSVPTISNNVIIGSGCSNYPVLSGTANCDDCTIDGPGAKLTVNTNTVLTINGDLTNAGCGCEFEMNGGTCTITGNFYSDVGCIVDINGGILNFTNWRRSSSSSWSKGTIELSGGTINASGDVSWSSSNVNGTMDGPFELYIGEDFRNRSTRWDTVTDGTITMTGSSGSGPFYCYANYYNYYLKAYNLVFDGAGKTFYLNHYSLSPTNLHVVNDLSVIAGTITTNNAGSKNEYIDVDGDLLINPEGKLTAETTSYFCVWGDAELQSDNSGTASLIQDANFNVYGDTYVMRHIPSNDDWHYISSPVTSAYSDVFAGAYMNAWNEPSYSWQHIQNLTTPLNIMQGYSVKLPYTYGNTAEFEGTLNTGNISSPVLTYTNTGSPSTDGFNLIGNPYPSSIDWDLATPLLPTGVDDAIYYWDPAAAQYKVYSMTGGGSGSQYIPPVQAVFIHCNSSLGTNEMIDLNNSVRTHEGSSTFYKNRLVENVLALKVTGEKYADETFIHINSSATAGFDGHYDAYKLFSPYKEVPHLYTKCNDLNLAINSLPFTGDEMIISLAFRSENPGIYTFDIQGVEKFIPEKPLYLVDRKEKMYIDLRQQSDYSYSYDIEEPEERFIICFKKSIVDEEFNKLPVNIYSFDRRIYIKTFQESLSGQVYIYNILGQLRDYIDFQNKYHMEIDLKHSDMVYIVKLIANGEVYTQKLIIN